MHLIQCHTNGWLLTKPSYYGINCSLTIGSKPGLLVVPSVLCYIDSELSSPVSRYSTWNVSISYSCINDITKNMNSPC